MRNHDTDTPSPYHGSTHPRGDDMNDSFTVDMLVILQERVGQGGPDRDLPDERERAAAEEGVRANQPEEARQEHLLSQQRRDPGQPRVLLCLCARVIVCDHALVCARACVFMCAPFARAFRPATD